MFGGGGRGIPMMNEHEDPELMMALRLSLEEANVNPPKQNI